MKTSKRVLGIIMTIIMVLSAVNFGAFAIEIDNGTPVESTQAMTDDGTGRLVIPKATVTATPVVRVGNTTNKLELGTTIVKATPSGVPEISGSYTKEAYAGETPTNATVIFESDLSLAATANSVSFSSTPTVTYTTSKNSNNKWTFTITGGNNISAGTYINYTITFDYKYTDSLTGNVITKTYQAYGSSYVENIIQPAGFYMDLYRTKPPTHSGTYHDVVYRILGLNTYGSYYNTDNDKGESLDEDCEHYSHGYFDFINNTEKNWNQTAASVPGYGLVLCCYDNGDGGKDLNTGLNAQRPVSTTYIDRSYGTALNGSNINLRYAFFDKRTTSSEGQYRKMLGNDTKVFAGDVAWDTGAANEITAANQLGFAAMNQEIKYLDNGTYYSNFGSYATAITNGSKVWGFYVPFNGTTYTSAVTTLSDGTQFVAYTLVTCLSGRYTKSDRVVSGTSPVSLRFYLYSKSELRGVISEALTQYIPVSPTGTEMGITPQSWYYTTATWNTFKAALTAAQQIAAKPNVNQGQIDTATNNLETAMDGLVLRTADYTTAENYINELANVDSSLYTAASWKAVTDARAPLLSKDYNIFYQNKVDYLTSVLAQKISELQYRGADYEAVDASIEAAGNIDRSLYTPASLATLDQLLTLANSTEFRSYDITHQEYIDSVAVQIDEAIEHLVLRDADYTAVNAAVARYDDVYPEKDYYTTASWSRVQSAYDQITYGLKITLQDMVDDMAADLNNAIDRLEYLPADYSRVDELVNQAALLNQSDYTPATWNALMDAINAVDYDLNIKQQNTVNGYATTIQSRINSLQWVVGDYTAVTNAITAARAKDQSLYTTASWNNLQNVIDSVVYGITKDRQAEIDAYAAAINNAIAALVLLPADYTAVQAQKDRYDNLDRSLYTSASLLAAREAYLAVVEGYTKDRQAEVDAMAANLKNALDNLVYKPGNYAAVNAAVTNANALIAEADAYSAQYAGHGYYTSATYNALKAAVSAVVYDLTIDKQSQIDGYAAAINTAISNLQKNTAYYAAVDAALQSVPSDLDSGRYTASSVAAVHNAVDAVVTGLLTDEQDTVDAYAAAINAAVAGLGINSADYSAVTAAINSIPADLSIYTSTSVANLNAKVNAVVYNLSYDDQARVDQFAADIAQAVRDLVPDYADYTDVDAAIARANAALASEDAPYYTDASKAAVTDAVNAVVRGKYAKDQAIVTGYATAINTAVNNLAFKPIDDSAFQALKTSFAGMDTSIYTDASVQAVRNAIANGEVFLAGDVNIKHQSQLDAIVNELAAAIDALEEKPANYDEVNRLVTVANGLNPDLYINFDVVTDTINNIEYGLKISQQDIVDMYAGMLQDAIDALVFKPIDTTAYEAAQATVPEDLSIYTADSVAAMNDAKDAIDSFLSGDVNISHQAQLDSLVAIYVDKISKLAVMPADYTALNAVLAEFIALDDAAYVNYMDAYQVYRTVNAWKQANPNKNITEQAAVDAQTQALRNAIDALIPISDVEDAYFRAKEGSTTVISGKYIYGLKTALTAGNLKNVFLEYSDNVTVTFTKAVPSARYYGTGSTVTVDYPDGTHEVYTIIIYGDVDGNGMIDVDDAYATRDAAAGLITFDTVQTKAGNVDGVRRISMDDYMIINEAAVGLRGINQVDPSDAA
jgi:hypothetical protein